MVKLADRWRRKLTQIFIHWVSTYLGRLILDWPATFTQSEVSVSVNVSDWNWRRVKPIESRRGRSLNEIDTLSWQLCDAKGCVPTSNICMWFACCFLVILGSCESLSFFLGRWQLYGFFYRSCFLSMLAHPLTHKHASGPFWKSSLVSLLASPGFTAVNISAPHRK